MAVIGNHKDGPSITSLSKRTQFLAEIMHRRPILQPFSRIIAGPLPFAGSGMFNHVPGATYTESPIAIRLAPDLRMSHAWWIETPQPNLAKGWSLPSTPFSLS